MNQNINVLGLLQQSYVTITAKNAEIERLQEENKRLKELQTATNVNINFFVPNGTDPADLFTNMKVNVEKEF